MSLAVALAFVGTATAGAAGTITGTVFQDYNSNGTRDTATTIANNGAGSVGTAIDVGVAGVTVTAYDGAGTAVGTTTSNAAGAYALSAGGIGPYRIEFTTLPAGYRSSFHGPDSGTSVQFVPDGNSSNVSVGINVPGDYCQNNPTLVTSCYLFGNQLGANTNGQPDVSGLPVIVSFPYSAGANSATPTDYDSPAHPTVALANQVGATWGLAYNRTARRLYSAAFFKRHAGFGPGGPGAIYVLDPSGATVLNTFTVPGATTNAHDTADYSTDNGNAGWNAVGTTSLGGIAISDDDSTLYAMNLENRTLYALNATTGSVIASNPVPLSVPGCPAATDVRPFAVQVHRGQLYAGMVCSGQSSGLTTDVEAYVYAVNPTTLAFGAAPVFQAPLDYPRGFANRNNVPAEWQAWTAAYATVDLAGADGGVDGYPQPILTDVSFDNGNLILGLRDRSGDQFGSDTLDNPATPATTYSARPAGDTLRACGSPATGWTLEANGRCAGVGTAPQATGEGPAGGEYYFRDEFTPPTQIFHDELALGGLVQVPGFPDVASTVYDPIPLVGQVFDGGVRWWSNGSGALTKGYRVYDELTTVGDFGKAAGLGDLVALCDAAPIEIGNRVWRDTNGDGVQAPTEAPIAGVTVQLVNGAGVVVGTATTDATGAYYFNATNVPGGVQPNTSYTVRIPAGQAALVGLVATQPVAGGNAARDSNGVTGAAGIVVSAITTGPAGANDHTVDFGFSPPVSLGNRVFEDINDNGRRDRGEPGISGVTLTLYRDDNADGVPDGPAIATTTTNAQGYYLFSGLSPGGYVVEAVPPRGLRSSTDIASSANPENNVDLDDNGGGRGTGAVRSGTIILRPGAEPSGEGATPGIGDATPDNSSNVTVDFGVTRGRTRLVITKRPNVRAQSAGGRIVYTIQIRNTGRAPARGVQICDGLPPGTVLVSAPGSRRINGRLCWDRTIIQPGRSVTVTVTVRVTRRAARQIVNRATGTSLNSPRVTTGATVTGIGVSGGGSPRPTG